MANARRRLSAVAAAIAGGPQAADHLAALPVASLLVRPDGRIATANVAAETLLNRAAGSLARCRLDDLVADAEKLGLMPERLAGGVAITAYDQIVLLGDGRRISADVLVAPLPDYPGWATVVFQSRSPTPLADGRRSLDGATRAMGAAAMLAHEVKNPLSGIRGAAQLLESHLDEEQSDLTRLIRDEVDRIAALIDRMEGFTDTRPLDFSAINIHAVLGHAREVAAQGFARSVTIREAYDPSLPPVLGNRDALVQIFLNLLKNSAEALGNPSDLDQIVISTAYRHGFSVLRDGVRQALPIEISVSDTGPGAPPGIADHLFDPFVSSKPSGTGLGLALVAKLVADHGGIISYAREGRPAHTVLRVLLPRAA